MSMAERVFRTMSKDPNVLNLTIRKAPFEDIVSGRKREEYRKATSYWTKRLIGRDFSEVRFLNGRSRESDKARMEFNGIERIGSFYRINLGRVLEVKRPKHD